MYRNSRITPKQETEIAIGIIVIVIITLALALIFESVTSYSNHVRGTLTAYDMNLNPKYTINGDFQYIGGDTWLDRNTGYYYTFDRAIIEHS